MEAVGSGESDEVLLGRVSAGDERALRTLVQRHERRLYAAALSMTRATWDAEEVVGVAFLELWRKRDKVRVVDGSVLPWLLKVVSFAAKNQMRGHRRYRRLLGYVPRPEDVPDHADEVARTLDGLLLSREIRDAIRAASATDASVILLCLVHEMSTRDAAIALGITEGTVKSRLSRARSRLQSRLAHHAPAAAAGVTR